MPSKRRGLFFRIGLYLAEWLIVWGCGQNYFWSNLNKINDKLLKCDSHVQMFTLWKFLPPLLSLHPQFSRFFCQYPLTLQKKSKSHPLLTFYCAGVRFAHILSLLGCHVISGVPEFSQFSAQIPILPPHACRGWQKNLEEKSTCLKRVHPHSQPSTDYCASISNAIL